jgi:hypothetical protein
MVGSLRQLSDWSTLSTYEPTNNIYIRTDNSSTLFSIDIEHQHLIMFSTFKPFAPFRRLLSLINIISQAAKFFSTNKNYFYTMYFYTI